MRTALGLILVLLANPALAEWRAMTGAEITAALTGQRLQYDSAWQVFHTSGRTLYNAGTDSWGNWRIDGDAYCSQWPPSDGWACYTVARDTDTGDLQFNGASGDVAVGRPAP